MNPRIKTVARSIVITAAFLGCQQAINAQILYLNEIYRHDQSGNLKDSNPLVGYSVFTSTSAPTIAAGGKIILSAFASGDTGGGPFTYQWLHNGGYIWDGTNATFFNPGATNLDAGSYSVIVTSAAGSVTNHVGDITVLASTDSLYSVAYGLGQYVAVGENGTIVHSADLITWWKSSSGTANQLESVTFGGNNIFVAVGTNATMLASINGVDWFFLNPGNTNHLRGVTYGNGTFVAVGSGGTTITSPDSVTWTTRTFDYPRLEAVTYGSNTFVAVGSGGTIWTSTNGINWFDRTFPTNVTLNGVTYGNGKFVAVGERGLILTSSDTTNWFLQASGSSQTFQAALFFSNTFFGVGPGGKNFLSANGTNWNDSDAGTFDLLFGATVGNDNPVAVGRNGKGSTIDFFDRKGLT